MEKLIFQKMCDVQADIEAVSKDRKNPSQGYSFRGIDDVYNMIHKIMAKHRVFSVPKVIESKREERKTASGGNLIYSILRVQYTFYAEDGSSVDSVVEGEGMDSGDKSSNKAMSGAEKYCLLQSFKIPTAELKDSESDVDPEVLPKQKDGPEKSNEPPPYIPPAYEPPPPAAEFEVSDWRTMEVISEKETSHPNMHCLTLKDSKGKVYWNSHSKDYHKVFDALRVPNFKMAIGKQISVQTVKNGKFTNVTAFKPVMEDIPF